MTQDYPSCYTSATDTSIVAIRTPAPLTFVGSQMQGSSLVTATSAPTITADSGNNSEASTASSTHPLSANNGSHPVQSLLSIGSGAIGYGSIADDVSDSADSEYRSLEGNDPEDSDSAAAPLPRAQDDRSDD
uniref:Uncharacterized protein n=1 Tax=Anopheles culicifacies TaxID=139723 RepID=A0A182MSP7_9DIPT